MVSVRDRADALNEELARDRAAGFELLVGAYGDRLFAFALNLLHVRHDAEDVAQDALVRAYGALRTYDDERVRTLALRAWLFRIVTNVAYNRRRKRPLAIVPIGSEALEAADPWTPERIVIASGDRDAVRAAIARLPRRYRTPLVLRYVHDLSYAEIAAVLGRPIATLRSDVFRAIALLRAELGAIEVDHEH